MSEGLASRVVEALIRKELTLATAESCTGGLVADRITDVPGSSAVLRGGFVTYTNEAKGQMVWVSADTLAKHTAVSAATAAEMATGALSSVCTSLGLATTGYAGPGDGADGTPAGTVHIALAFRKQGSVEVWLRKLEEKGRTRREVKEAAATAALSLVEEWLQENS